jgi:hypothetical protein
VESLLSWTPQWGVRPASPFPDFYTGAYAAVTDRALLYAILHLKQGSLAPQPGYYQPVSLAFDSNFE